MDVLVSVPDIEVYVDPKTLLSAYVDTYNNKNAIRIYPEMDWYNVWLIELLKLELEEIQSLFDLKQLAEQLRGSHEDRELAVGMLKQHTKYFGRYLECHYVDNNSGMKSIYEESLNLSERLKIYHERKQNKNTQI